MTLLTDAQDALAQLRSSIFYENLQAEITEGKITQAQYATTHVAAVERDLVSMLAQLQPQPPPAPTPQPDFTKTLAAGGDLDAFLSSLKPGDRAGIEPGDYSHQPIGHSNGGTSSAGIFLGATDRANPPRLSGRLDLRQGFAYWTFDHLVFRDNTVSFTTYQVSWVNGGQHCVFQDCDFSNAGTKIGMEQINSSTYGVGADNTLIRCWFHKIGRHPYGSTNNDHCFYDVGLRTHAIDCIFEDASDRGVQLRGANGALVENCTIATNGEGVIFGDIGAVNCIVRKCILLNRQVKTRALIEEYDPSGHDSGNAVTDCYAFNADGGPVMASYVPVPKALAMRDLLPHQAIIETELGPRLASYGASLHSVSVTSLHTVDPQLDPTTMLPKAGSPAVGYGARVALPRITV